MRKLDKIEVENKKENKKKDLIFMNIYQIYLKNTIGYWTFKKYEYLSIEHNQVFVS